MARMSTRYYDPVVERSTSYLPCDDMESFFYSYRHTCIQNSLRSLSYGYACILCHDTRPERHVTLPCCGPAGGVECLDDWLRLSTSLGRCPYCRLQLVRPQLVSEHEQVYRVILPPLRLRTLTSSQSSIDRATPNVCIPVERLFWDLDYRFNVLFRSGLSGTRLNDMLLILLVDRRRMCCAAMRNNICFIMTALLLVAIDDRPYVPVLHKFTAETFTYLLQ